MQFKVNPLDEIDFYKAGHYAQYPENTVEIYSNFTPRSSRTDMKYVIVAGIQIVIKDIHENWKNNFFNLSNEEFEEMISEYEYFMDSTIYPGAVTIDHIRNVYNLGYLPLEIMALPEGTLRSVGVPILTIRNTHPDAFWLVNYLESKLSNALWKPITSATTAFQYLKKFNEFADITGANKDFIQWQGHDFSYRGMSGNEDAIPSGIAHLFCFTGTDTVPAIKAMKYHYNADWKTELVGASVVATEHSVMCAGSKEGEFQTFERLLTKFPTNILSVVSDTWDYWQVIVDYLPRLKDKVMSRNGRLVIRPDSGDPVDIICGKNVVEDKDYLTCADDIEEFFEDFFRDDDRSNLSEDQCGQDLNYIAKINNQYYNVFCEGNYIKEHTSYSDTDVYTLDDVTVTYKEIVDLKEIAEIKGSIEVLWDIFGGTTNEKGYKVLDPHIGMIYGDSITLKRQEEILRRLKEKGFTADNLVLGIGSFTYEYVTRDTYGMAMKATNVVKINDSGELVSTPIFKDPKTQAGKAFTKTSAKGYLKVSKDGKLVDNLQTLEETYEDTLLEICYFNGAVTRNEKLSKIRNRIKQNL